MNSNCHKELHEKKHETMLHDFLVRLLWCTFLTVPILFLSPMTQSMVGMSFHFHGQNVIIFLLSTIIFLYGGKPFIVGMQHEVMSKKIGMMTLVSLSIIIAYGYSSATIFWLGGESFFIELATLIDIMLFGHWVEMRAIKGTSQALERLALLLPAQAHKKYSDGSIRDVETAELAIDDIVIIRPGEKISTDGTVLEGSSETNEAALTGELVPIFKTAGLDVIAGSINGDGALTVRVTRVQKDAYIFRIIKLVAQAIEGKSRDQDLADQAAFYLTICALIAGIITFVGWVFVGSLSLAFQHTVTVMVTACPHALGLAIPLVLTVVTTLCAKSGILIRNRMAFERAKDINVVVFDKTGTLTEGNFKVTDVSSYGTMDTETLLAYAAAVEQYAKHTIANAIVAHAEKKGLALPEATKSKVFSGYGACSTIQNQEVFVGSARILDLINFINNKAEESKVTIQESLNQLSKQGKTAIYVVTSDGVQGVIALTDIIRSEAKEACAVLKSKGIQVMMITGDNKITAQIVAHELGLEAFLAEVLPDQKAIEVQKLQKTGEIVAMVGDGINDAPALAMANVGIAIGAGTDIAIETAGIILVKNDPRAVVDIINLSRLTRKKIIQNLFWAVSYNVVMIPIATGFFAPYGITMSPAMGALVMSVSTIVVALNARLIFYKQK